MFVQGHTKAVWAAISIGDVGKNANFVLTGGADNVIIAWKDHLKLQTYEGEKFIDSLNYTISSFFSTIGHTNCVRSLVAVNENEFLSCSNDDSIKRWTINSVRCLQTYQGHTSFVYSISIISPDRFASVSEDRSLRIWSLAESEAKQTIRLPSTSIWSVCSLTNSDVVAGCRFVR